MHKPFSVGSSQAWTARIIAAPLRVLMLVSVLALPFGAHAQSSSNDAFRQLNLFGDVFERVRGLYVEEKTDKELIEAAIRGMLTSLDPHSSYMPADDFEEMQVDTRGTFGGLGIEVTMEDGLVKVVSPIDETPAERAGMQSGDLITHLDGDPVMGLTLAEAVEKMRGLVGEDIIITVLRGEQDPFDVTITRDVIKIRSVRTRVEDETIGYLRIGSFTGTTYEGLEKGIRKLQEENGDKISAYILDLRNNPGGLLNQAISVSDAFLEKGEIVSTRGRDGENVQRFNAEAGDLIDGKPLLVLINGGSASASEIVAGALQDHGRAVIMGTRSFGKGSVQSIMEMPGFGAIRMTTARYYTPAGTSIQAKGIAPDLIVEQSKVESLEIPNRRREADLRGALDTSKEEDGTENADETTDEAAEDESAEPANEDGAKDDAEGDAPVTADEEKDETAEDKEPEEEVFVDYQLQQAKNMLRGLALFSKISQ
ncbi:MAG: S41 family peptidase [Alphaproteobacteria bacterium]